MKRIILVVLAIAAILWTPVLAECVDCPDLMEELALNCPRCFGGSATNDGMDDPTDDPPPDPDKPNYVTCIANITDAVGEPAPNVQINLNTDGAWNDTACSCSPGECLWGVPGCEDCDSGELNPGRTCDTAYTDENGYAFLQAWAEPEWNMNFAYCQVYPEGDPAHVYAYYGGHQGGPRITNMVSLRIGETDDPSRPNIDYVPFDAEIWLDGLDPTKKGHGTRYLSGNYDRVLVLVQPFDPRDNLEVQYSWIEWFDYYKHLIFPAYAEGYDVWLFEPGHSGDNVYEQASELAQLIQHAHELQPATDEPGTERKVVVVGQSTGGLVARTALARWSDTTGNSQAWKDMLGLDAEPPVRMLGALDSPLFGSNFPVDIQKRMWALNREWDFNLDSCFMRQTLKAWCTEDSCDSTGFVNFFGGEGGIPGQCSSGIDLMFPRTEDGTLRSVTSLGDQGYPAGVRVVATSNGRLGERNQCYADSRDENAAGAVRRKAGGNGTTGRICGGRPPRGTPLDELDQWVWNNVDPAVFSVGDTMINLDFGDTCTAIADRLGLREANVDGQALFWGWDVVPGSRHDLVLEEAFVELLSNGALDDISDLIQLVRWFNLFLSFDSLGDLLSFSSTDCGESLGVQQLGMGTNVPSTSAFDIRSCPSPTAECQFRSAAWLDSNGYGAKHPRIDATCENDHSGTHERNYDNCVNFVMDEIDAQFGLETSCYDGGPDFCFPVCGDGPCDTGETADSCCKDCGDCCDNDVCEEWEDFNTCPFDCAPLDCNYGDCGGLDEVECCHYCGICPPVCDNDGQCESGEDIYNCPNDCSPDGSSNCVKGVCVGDDGAP